MGGVTVVTGYASGSVQPSYHTRNIDMIQNRNSLSAQIGNQYIGPSSLGFSPASPLYTTVNTTVGLNLAITLIANPANTNTLETVQVEVIGKN